VDVVCLLYVCTHVLVYVLVYVFMYAYLYVYLNVRRMYVICTLCVCFCTLHVVPNIEIDLVLCRVLM
jgi:hypothetical protein